MITRHFGIPVTSPGAILRRERDLGTPLGQETAEVLRSGGLVSDKIIIELIEDWLRLHGGHGFVFDGFPWIWRFGWKYRRRLFAIASPGGFNAASAVLRRVPRVHSSPIVPCVRIATADWSAATMMI